MDQQKRQPTLMAIKMKREQNDIQEKQIVTLLDRRRELSDAQRQNDTDLEFVGYVCAQTPAPEERLTDSAWRERYAHQGMNLYDQIKVEEVYAQCDILTRQRDSLVKERALLNNEVKALKKLLKGVKITGKKK